MAIITFWNDSREQSGKTMAAVAVATSMAIEKNSKILLVSTGLDDMTIRNCFWGDDATKNAKIFGGKMSNIAVENGIEGLLKLVTSNKLTPSIITDYTKVVFKDRLEVLCSPSNFTKQSIDSKIAYLRNMEQHYIELIKTASQYYDIVLVDLDKMLSTKTREEILRLSNVNIYVLSQKMESLNRFIELKEEEENLFKNRCIPVIGKYDNRFKYNSKNIARYLKEKKELDLIPLNLLYMGAAEEASVVDLFLRLRNVKDKTDENYIFIECITNLTNKIIKKIQEMQMRTR